MERSVVKTKENRAIIGFMNKHVDQKRFLIGWSKRDMYHFQSWALEATIGLVIKDKYPKKLNTLIPINIFHSMAAGWLA